MPSIFGHSAAGATAAYVGKSYFPDLSFKKFLFYSLIATNISDIDIYLFQSHLGTYEALPNFLKAKDIRIPVLSKKIFEQWKACTPTPRIEGNEFHMTKCFRQSGAE